MDVVGLLWRARLRRQWRAHIALVLLLSLGAGTALACVAGARRTASSFGRIAAEADAYDLSTSHGAPPEAAIEVTEGLDGVARYDTVVGFVGRLEGFDPTLIKYFIGSWDNPLAFGRPLLTAGRYPRPDRPDEVLVSGIGVEKGGIEPGDVLVLDLSTSDFSGTVRKELVVTGTGRLYFEVAQDSAQDRSSIWFTPAFTRANASQLRQWSSTALSAEPGTDPEAVLIPQLLAVGWSPDETLAATHARVQDAVRPLTITLAALGVLVLITTLVVIGQALARQAEAWRGAERLAIRAIGVTPVQARSADALFLLAVAVPGALLAIAVAVGASPLFPVGSARPLEPERGIAVDATVLGLGAVVAILLLLAGDRLGDRRSRGVSRRVPPLQLITAASAQPVLASGLRLATGGTSTERRRFSATVGFAALALAMVIGGVAFVSALDRLIDEPVRYGVGWDLTARNAFGEVPPDDLRALVDGDRDIDGMAGASLTGMLLDGSLSVSAIPILPITAELWPTIIDGAIPRGPGEILVGADVLDRLDAAIGDTVTMKNSLAETASIDVTIVGTAVFPSVDLAGVDATRLSDGVAVTWDDHLRLQDAGVDREPDIVFFDLADGVDPQVVIDRYADGLPETTGISETEWFPSLAPGEVRETSRATSLIWTVVGLLAVTVLATVAHALATTVRHRRRDYAVLKALGFTRRQVLSAVAWQSLATVAVALVVGVPLGVALGRSAWRVFADLLGVIDTPVLPVTALLVAISASLLVGALVAVGPGRRAGRTPAARVLSGE